MRTKSKHRRGAASMEVVMATAVAVPLAGLVFFLGIAICRYVFGALSGMLLQPFM